MRIPCPFCGPRDRREFYYYGASAYLDRPSADAPEGAWDDYLHLRDNPAGPTRDLWYHELGCAAWLEVERDTVSHEILAVRAVGGAGAPPGKPARTAPARKAPRAAPGAATVTTRAKRGKAEGAA